MDDVRDGTPVGMVRASLYLPDGYIKANGATVLRADYPRLVNLADKHNLWTEDTANYPGLFGVGDGLTTFTVPNWIDRMAQFGTGIGDAISAGLPNIAGVIAAMVKDNSVRASNSNALGAFAFGADSELVGNGGTYTGYRSATLEINSNGMAGIYGNSDTVQPPAIGVLPVIKY